MGDLPALPRRHPLGHRRRDCAALGWNGYAHRGFLSDSYVGVHPASFAEGLAFQENPATGDRRISGSAASLAELGTARTPAHADDNRGLHRPTMPWHRVGVRPDPRTDAGRMWAGLHRLVDVRRGLEALHASVPTRVYPTSHPSVVCLVRRHPAGDIVQVYNVSDATVALPADDIAGHGAHFTLDRLSDRHATPHSGQHVLRPNATWWLTEAT